MTRLLLFFCIPAVLSSGATHRSASVRVNGDVAVLAYVRLTQYIDASGAAQTRDNTYLIDFKDIFIYR